MRLIGIAIKPARRGPMELRSTVHVSAEAGLTGDCRGGGRSKKRQITILSHEGWSAACKDIGFDLAWHVRRANLYVSEEIFGPSCVGQRLVINDVVLEITGETIPCDRMDAIYLGLRAALVPEWRGGLTARVYRGGYLTLGDAGLLLP